MTNHDEQRQDAERTASGTIVEKTARGLREPRGDPSPEELGAYPLKIDEKEMDCGPAPDFTHAAAFFAGGRHTLENFRNDEAPPHLTEPTRRWFQSIIATHKLPDHKLRLLTMAAEALDRCDQARAIIEREGLTTTTRDGGLKTHPACRVERDSRLAFARLMRALALDATKSRPTLPGSAMDEQLPAADDSRFPVAFEAGMLKPWP